MMKLHPSFVLPVMPDETPKSSASRTAHRIGRTLRGLLRDLDIEFNELVGGEPDAVRKLEAAFGFPAGVFDGRTFRRVQGLKFAFGTELLPRDAMRRTTMHVCPACLDEDVAGPLGKEGRYGRWYWELAQYRCCIKHQCLLVPIRGDGGTERDHHFAWHLGGHGDEMLVAQPVSSTELSSYLVDRLAGKVAPSWLSSMPLHAAAKTCEMVGVIMNLGVNVNWRDVSPNDWVDAGNTGYRQLSLGREGLVAFLQDRRAAAPPEEFGLLKLYGSLYEYIARTRDTAYAAVADVFREHILATTVVAPGAMVLGKLVEKRTHHSVRSASVEYGLHPTTLRKHLTDIGIIDGDAAALPQDRSLFDAEAHAPFLEQLVEAMPRKAAQRYLGLSRTLTGLINPPFVQPVTHGKYGCLENLFTKSALDAFQHRMTSSALPLSESDIALVSIGNAAHKAQRNMVDIVNLLLDGRLNTVRQRPDLSPIRGLMVDPVEVRELLSPASEILTMREVKKHLQSSWGVVRRLVGCKVLPSSIVRHPLNHQETVVVSRSDLAAFDGAFASVHVLAQQIGRHGKWLLFRLRQRGIEPEFDPTEVGTEFYRRSLIEPILTQI